MLVVVAPAAVAAEFEGRIGDLALAPATALGVVDARTGALMVVAANEPLACGDVDLRGSPPALEPMLTVGVEVTGGATPLGSVTGAMYVSKRRQGRAVLEGGGHLARWPAGVGSVGELEVDLRAANAVAKGTVAFMLCDPLPAPIPTSAPLESRELELDGLRIRALVPSGWKQEDDEAHWFGPDQVTGLWYLPRCGSAGAGCDPAGFRDAAADWLADLATPPDPTWRAEVLESGEIAPGTWLTHFRWTSAGGHAQESLHARRWLPGWPKMIECRIDTSPGRADSLPALREACLTVEVVSTP